MPSSRSRRPPDDDDRPRRRRRDDDDEDENDRPRKRRLRRKSRGPNVGLIVGLVAAGLAVVGVIVLAVLYTGGSLGGLGGADISYEKFKPIDKSNTIEALETKFGKARKLERAEWTTVTYGGTFQPPTTLGDIETKGFKVDSVYLWENGEEKIYVGTGTDHTGRKGLIFKLYQNPNARKINESRADPNNPGDTTNLVVGFEFVPLF